MSLPQTTIETADEGPRVFMYFDCVVSLQHNKRVSLTKHEVETGSRIADHVVHEPQSYRLRAILNDAVPVLDDDSRPIYDLPPNQFGGITFTNDAEGGRPAQIYDVLVQLCEKSRLVRIDNPMLPSVVRPGNESFVLAGSQGLFLITEVSTTKDTRKALEVDIAIEEVRFATSFLADIPQSLLTLIARRKQKGRVAPVTCNAAEQAKVDAKTSATPPVNTTAVLDLLGGG